MSLMAELKRQIQTTGPMNIAEYMRLCLGHPRYGYYIQQTAFGQQGDFITAPEISQVFGELIGLWLAQAWLDQGAPDPFYLVELGPGRGTLMADLLRTVRNVPNFYQAARLVFVETSPRLRKQQAENIAQSGLINTPIWCDNVSEIPEGTTFLIANEFFDALPIQQYQHTERGWKERVICLQDKALCYGLSAVDVSAFKPIETALAHLPIGTIYETSPISLAIAQALGKRLTQYGGAALIIDYGYTGQTRGNTFQAVKAHQYTDPLVAPGQADLTAHVAFADLAEAFYKAGACPAPYQTQGAFLRALGIEMRMAQLAQRNPTEKAALISAQERLIDPAQMGDLFKVLAVSPPKISLPLF